MIALRYHSDPRNSLEIPTYLRHGGHQLMKEKRVAIDIDGDRGVDIRQQVGERRRIDGLSFPRQSAPTAKQAPAIATGDRIKTLGYIGWFRHSAQRWMARRQRVIAHKGE